jgi:hypothetical protein
VVLPLAPDDEEALAVEMPVPAELLLVLTRIGCGCSGLHPGAVVAAAKMRNPQT